MLMSQGHGHCWLKSPSDMEVCDSCEAILAHTWVGTEETMEEFTLNSDSVWTNSTVAPALQAEKTELSSLGLYEPQPICWLEGSLIPGCPQDLVTS